MEKPRYEIEVEAEANPLTLMMDKDRSKEFQVSLLETRGLSFETCAVAQFIVSFSGSVAASVIANGLYDLITKHSKGKTDKIVIDRKTITLDKGEIQKVVEEHIEIERRR